MKFVATKTADQFDLQALHRVRDRLVGQRTGVINQIRAFLLERGIAVRQEPAFPAARVAGYLVDVLSPRMLRIIEGLAEDWRRLDERIEGLSSVIGLRATDDGAWHWPDHLERNGGRDRQGDVFPKAATSAPGLDLCRSRYRPATARSLAVYQGGPARNIGM
jgi:hypothetical protein